MGENPNKEVVLFDPVLFSISCWMSQYDKAEIKKFCCTVFSRLQLQTAMRVISDTEKLAGVRQSTNHIKMELCFDSILNNMEHLDQEGHLPVYAVKSSDANALPMAAPVDNGDGIPHGRLSVVEKAVSTLIVSNKEMMDKLDQINRIQPLYSDVISGQPPSTIPVVRQQSQSIPNVSLPPPMHSRPPPNQARQPSYTAVVPHKVPNASQKTTTQNVSADALDTTDWSTVHRRRPKVIRGTSASICKANPTNVRIGWTPAPRDIFVYHTNHMTTTNDISDLMIAQSKVTPMNVEKRSKEFAYFGSFRVTVRRDDFDEAMKAEHWPAGWSIREYYVSRERREVERLQRANGNDSSNALVNINDPMNTQQVVQTNGDTATEHTDTSGTSVVN